MPPIQRFHKLLIQLCGIITILASSACSLLSQPAPTPVPTMQLPTAASMLTRIPVSTSIPTLAPTLTPTITGTPRPLDTLIPTVQPSPTPPGFYSDFNSGFSLTYPTSWEIDSQKNSQLSLLDRKNYTFMVMWSKPDKQALSQADQLEAVKAAIGPDTTITPGIASGVELADGMMAHRVEADIKIKDQSLKAWVVYAFKINRSYLIFFLSAGPILSFRHAALEHVLKTVHLFIPQPFGLPHDQTLVLLGGKPDAKSLDPATTTTSSADYVGLLFSGLVRLAPDLKIVPALAKSWQINPEGTVYTFSLQPKAKFSSGDPLTARDVKASWERVCDPKTGSTTAATYLGDILGVKDKLAGKANEIQGVRVIDDRTLEITLDGPKPYFLAKLTYPTSAVVDTRQTGADSKGWMFTPNSSGPYKLRDSNGDQGITFERNPYYFEPISIANLVFLYSAGDVPASVYADGSVDILPVSAADVKRISQPDDPLHAQLQTVPSMCTSLIQLNPNRAPLDDLHVRKALLLATDRGAMVEKLTNNTALLANGVLPPAMPGFLPKRSLPAFDPAAAKAELKQSKYASGPLQITLSVSGFADSQRKDVALLADMWKQNLGIQVKIQFLDPSDFTKAARTNPGNATLYGWCADYPDPENFLDILFHSQSEFNITGLNDPTLDALLEKARTEIDPQQRLILYAQAEDRVLAEVDTIPLMNEMLGELVNPRVKNYVLSSGQAPILPWVSLDPTAQ